MLEYRFAYGFDSIGSYPDEYVDDTRHAPDREILQHRPVLQDLAVGGEMPLEPDNRCI